VSRRALHSRNVAMAAGLAKLAFDLGTLARFATGYSMVCP
jgi:hypothetical protein